MALALHYSCTQHPCWSQKFNLSPDRQTTRHSLSSDIRKKLSYCLLRQKMRHLSLRPCFGIGVTWNRPSEVADAKPGVSLWEKQRRWPVGNACFISLRAYPFPKRKQCNMGSCQERAAHLHCFCSVLDRNIRLTLQPMAFHVTADHPNLKTTVLPAISESRSNLCGRYQP
jgi:hypothetical protein